MTPKEEAIFIFSQYLDYVNCWDDEGNCNYEMAKQYAKECSLIHINAVLNVVKSNNLLQNNIIHFEEVKQEIENL
jgi:hypothetical protein